ncbi:hypothetical protein T440DRAFT_520126 [Plenodomus tracheiphilus IPT5]|uniref:Uncharacterized protein n=1 Tax=Plenodomus tracheiphilus IPT5 TaxID=1408161 RepID=A0A6A7AZA2_9PLEO|nr:hypothetical protein T440DRAFT_520126 [Plenodomus tracheiphilus IPT5]
MAQHFGDPSLADRLNDEDEVVLQLIYQRKIKGVPEDLLEELTLPLDAITRGKSSNQLFPFEPNSSNIPSAVTFAGHLHCRGEIMENVNYLKLPIGEWRDEVLLAYFTSNVDKYRNFHIFFKQTRARLFDIFVRRVSNDASQLEEAYLLACMEYKRHHAVLDTQYPVKHQEYFISLFKANSACFSLPGSSRIDNILGVAGKHIKKLREERWAKLSESSRIFINFIAPLRGDATKDYAPKTKKKRNRGKRGNGRTAFNDDDPDKIAPVDPAYRTHEDFIYDTERIVPCAKDNVLMQGLIAAMPGLRFGTNLVLEIEGDIKFGSRDFLNAMPEFGMGDANMGGISDGEEDYANKEWLSDNWGEVLLL